MKTSEKYLSISELREEKHSTTMLCELFDVSPSGYFSSLSRPESNQNLRRKDLTQKVIAVFNEHKKRYGRIRIYQQLKKQGEIISIKMVGSIMRSEKLRAKKKRPFRPCTTQANKRSRWVPNLIKDLGIPSEPNKVLTSDITYVATREGWLYLAGVMDLHSRFIKGWSISEHMPTALVNKALDQAMNQYPELREAIVHSDRGCQYTSHQYLQKLQDYGLKPSMSAKGNCYDNAAMESFWSTLKTECFPESGIFETREQARQTIFEYIEGYYHTCRMHSALNYKTPLEVEKRAA